MLLLFVVVAVVVAVVVVVVVVAAVVVVRTFQPAKLWDVAKQLVLQTKNKKKQFQNTIKIQVQKQATPEIQNKYNSNTKTHTQ